MKPGRELDALVAEKVMGRCGHTLRRVQDHHQCQKCGEEFWGLAWHKGYCAFPSFSTDIAAAWNVVERLKDRYFLLQYYGDGWDCQIGGTSRTGNTVPLAICLAALKAVGVEVEDE